MSGVISPFALAQPLPWIPADNGLLLASAAPDSVASTVGPLVAGTQYLGKIMIRQPPVTVSQMWLMLSSAGVGASTGTFVGLLSSAGQVLGVSADCAAAFTGPTGAINIPFTASVQLPGPFVWGVVLSNLATTQPNFRVWATPTSTVADFNLTPALYRSATNGTALTAITAVTPSANATSGFNIWTGLS